MELFFNDLSLHGQFPGLLGFAESIGRVMQMRTVARRYGRDLRCHRSTVDGEVAPGRSVRTVAHTLGRDHCSVLMQWLTKIGPFWGDERRHGKDDYLECRGEVVTDSGIGEAAYGAFHEVESGVVSMKPSDWMISPLSVAWVEDSGTRRVEVANFWETETLRAAVEDAQPPMSSWKDLAQRAGRQCPDLRFSADAFERLNGTPFHPGVAERLLLRLKTLQQVKTGFDDRGRRTPEADHLLRTQFAGEKSSFSDSSASEKSEFRSALTFSHPEKPGESLFCPWHGKVKTPQLRVHFSWPIEADTPLFVVYVGPKITKR